MNRMFFKREFVWGLVLLIAAFMLPIVYNVPVKAASDGDMEVVIVIDTSGSMKSSDPERVAIEGAKLFIDMMSLDGSSVAVVPFSDTIGNTIPMTSVNSATDKQRIKNDIGNIKYTGDTDIGLALKTAYSLFDFSKKDSKAIVFFTDGKIDLGKKRVRTDDDSLQDVRDIVRQAREDNLSIYSIGLSVDNSVDEQLLSDIALNTEGRSFVIKSADSLPMIFDEIFADYIESKIISLSDIEIDGDKPKNVEFTIDNNSVMEANIVLLTSSKLNDVNIFNPSGQDLSSLSNVHVEKSENYTLFKIISPQMGTWRMQISGNKGCKVHVNLILNYQVDMKCTAVLNEVNGKASIHVEAWLEKDEVKLVDEDLLKSFVSRVEYECSDKSYVQDMTCDIDTFATDILTEALSGDVLITCILENDTMFRKSAPITVSIPVASADNGSKVKENEPPYFKGLPERIELSGLVLNTQKEKINLQDYIIDPEGDEFSIETKSANADIASSEIQKENKLIIRAVAKGETYIDVIVKDTKGGVSKQSIQVSCKGIFTNFFPILGIIAGAIVLILTAIIICSKLKVKNQRLYGTIQWEIGRGGISKRYSFEYDKGRVILGNIIQGDFSSALGLDKVTVRMNKSGDGIIIESKSGKCKLSNEYGEENSIVEVGTNQAFFIDDSTGNLQNKIQVRYYEG